ncbi:hypothetical protein L1987_63917 [Smallanthus sonchifolius]|uniref:Uncharacterized protein n=1 Tax=Smallanthus sonchifolius TaxID=185202 RepID=A0ACB9CEW4_9ASTR|nr:hypothetical protein L1987_63917 [Smallanthus sonchifolius]
MSSKEEEMEIEQDEGNQQEAEAEAEVDVEIEIPHVQEEEQLIDEPVQEAAFVEEVQIHVEPVVNVDVDVHEDYYKSDSDIQTEPPASSSNRPADTDSDYEHEEPKAKKIKTGFEDVSSSSDLSADTPQPTPQPTPPPSPQQVHIPTPPPSPQQVHIPTPPPSPQHENIPTPPTSPSHEPTTFVPRVKTLSLEVKKLQDHVQKKDELEVQQTQLETQQRLISKQHEEYKALAEIVEQLKASLIKHVQQQTTTSTAKGETTSSVEPSSPAFVTDPESAMTTYTGHAAKTKEVVEVKGTETEIETVILNEEDIPSDDELNALLDEIDNFGYNELYPEILPTEEQETEKMRYFTDEGDEIQALSDEEKTEEEVQVNIVKPTVPDTPTPPTSEANSTFH